MEDFACPNSNNKYYISKNSRGGPRHHFFKYRGGHGPLVLTVKTPLIIKNLLIEGGGDKGDRREMFLFF